MFLYFLMLIFYFSNKNKTIRYTNFSYDEIVHFLGFNIETIDNMFVFLPNTKNTH